MRLLRRRVGWADNSDNVVHFSTSSYILNIDSSLAVYNFSIPCQTKVALLIHK